MNNKIPRRIRLDQLTAEELELYNIVQQVEALGAHPLLTDVVVLLGQARSKLADWVDLPKCVDCGATDIRPFDNGDGKTRCEACAVKKYKGQ